MERRSKAFDELSTNGASSSYRSGEGQSVCGHGRLVSDSWRGALASIPHPVPLGYRVGVWPFGLSGPNYPPALAGFHSTYVLASETGAGIHGTHS
jgi:hypothetical protein